MPPVVYGGTATFGIKCFALIYQMEGMNVWCERIEIWQLASEMPMESSGGGHWREDILYILMLHSLQMHFACQGCPF